MPESEEGVFMADFAASCSQLVGLQIKLKSPGLSHQIHELRPRLDLLDIAVTAPPFFSAVDARISVNQLILANLPYLPFADEETPS